MTYTLTYVHNHNNEVLSEVHVSDWGAVTEIGSGLEEGEGVWEGARCHF